MLPFALGLLGIAGLGQKALWSMMDQRAAGQREQFGQTMRTMQEGLDLSKEEGQQALAAKMLQDPRMIEYGNRNLSESMSRAQQGRQWQWGNENLTKAQQENIALSKQEIQQRAAEAKDRSALGWAGLEQQGAYNNAMLQKQDHAARAAAMKSLMPDIEGIQRQENYLRDTARTSLKPYQDTLGNYNTAMGVINNPDASPLDRSAAITMFAKTFDPGSVVSTTEGDRISASAGGLSQQLSNLLQKAQSGKMTEDMRRQFSSTLNAAIEQKAAQAMQARAYIEANAQQNPITGMPAFNTEPFFTGVDFEPTKKWQQKLPSPAVKPNQNGEFSDEDVDKMIKARFGAVR